MTNKIFIFDFDSTFVQTETHADLLEVGRMAVESSDRVARSVVDGTRNIVDGNLGVASMIIKEIRRRDIVR